MDFELKSVSLDQSSRLSLDALLVAVPDGLSISASGDDPLSRLISQALAPGGLEEGVGKLLVCFRPAGIKAARVVLVRTGQSRPSDVKKAIAAAAAQVRQPGTAKVGLMLSTLTDVSDALPAAVQAMSEAHYVYTQTKPSAKPSPVRQVVIGVPDASAVRDIHARACAVAHGIGVAREWANRPANHATPTQLADAARSLARKGGFDCQVLGEKDVKALGMGAFLAVAQGSEQPLKFIVLRHQGGARSEAPHVLVGKGITFDTGGISLKPAAEMDEMKFDMSGAASVLGTFAALSQLKLPVNVIGVIPACENMPGGAAIKPGDVVTSMSGQTIEILNTDAEGRLILCDALTYVERFKPRAVIDIATLTGACVIALGAVRSGLFSTNDELAQALHAAGEASLDPCWRMPMDDEYAEGLKSNFADMGNVAGRAAGSITAAKFLEKYAAKMPWAHLDIAGTAWRSGASKGATGRPVGLLMQYLIAQAQDSGTRKTTQRAPGRAKKR
ncbi:MAG: leucyl aminopeptidase [Pseudomonadota bacterium]